MDHNSQIRNVYTAAGMQENRKLDADTNGTTAEEAEGSAYPEKTADEKKEQEKQAYQEYMKEITPKKNLALQMLKAFLTGGVICVIGQVILNYCQSLGMEKDIAGSWCSLLLILLSVLLTGFSIYQVIAAWGGAGALVPITGFANSVASPAIEYKAEGQVYGIGVKIFPLPVLSFYMVFLQAEFWAFSTGSGSCWAGYKKALQKWHRGTDREEQTERKNREKRQREKSK